MSPDIAYLRPPPEQSDHNGSEDSQLHNFSSKSADKETIKPSGQFLPDKHVPGFGDDDRQPNTAGYEHGYQHSWLRDGTSLIFVNNCLSVIVTWLSIFIHFAGIKSACLYHSASFRTNQIDK